MRGRIEPVAFRAAFTAWATAAWPGLGAEQLCIEGNAVRGRRDGANPAVQVVSAFAGRARGVLAPPAVAEPSKELTALPDRLARLDLPGAVVSLDARGCQNALAQPLVEAGADYGRALKDHPPTGCEAVPLGLETDVAHGPLPVLETVEKDHGRIDSRRDALSRQIDWLAAKPEWAGLQAVGRVESTRLIGEKTSTEGRYVLCAFPERDRFATTVGQHGGLENHPHGVLDVHFGEEACRTRHDPSAENLAVIRRRALNVLRHKGPARDSLRRRQRRAALNDDYRLRRLLGQPSPATA